jgi:hypothetical protein
MELSAVVPVPLWGADGLTLASKKKAAEASAASASESAASGLSRQINNNTFYDGFLTPYNSLASEHKPEKSCTSANKVTECLSIRLPVSDTVPTSSHLMILEEGSEDEQWANLFNSTHTDLSSPADQGNTSAYTTAPCSSENSLQSLNETAPNAGQRQSIKKAAEKKEANTHPLPQRKPEPPASTPVAPVAEPENCPIDPIAFFINTVDVPPPNQCINLKFEGIQGGQKYGALSKFAKKFNLRYECGISKKKASFRHPRPFLLYVPFSSLKTVLEKLANSPFSSNNSGTASVYQDRNNQAWMPLLTTSTNSPEDPGLQVHTNERMTTQQNTQNRAWQQWDAFQASQQQNPKDPSVKGSGKRRS